VITSGRLPSADAEGVISGTCELAWSDEWREGLEKRDEGLGDYPSRRRQSGSAWYSDLKAM